MSPRSESRSAHSNELSGSDLEAFIGQQIRLRRMLMGLTQAQLASLLGVASQHVHQFERGLHLNASRLYALSKAMLVPVEILFPPRRVSSEMAPLGPLQNSLDNLTQVDLELKHDGRLQPQALAIVKAFRQMSLDDRGRVLAWVNALNTDPGTPAPELSKNET